MFINTLNRNKGYEQINNNVCVCVSMLCVYERTCYEFMNVRVNVYVCV